jgi:hypothetical protein
MPNLSFTQSPLITPERLYADLAEALEGRPSPDWVEVASLAYPDLPIDENVCVVRAGHKKRDQYDIDPVSLAARFELTRFAGIGVTTNTRGKRDSASALWYLKITFANAPKDNMPVWRLVADALPHEEVSPGDVPNDLRLAMLGKRPSGAAIKDARAIALKHAAAAARHAAPAGFNIAEYAHNISILFDLHDRLFKGAGRVGGRGIRAVPAH